MVFPSPYNHHVTKSRTDKKYKDMQLNSNRSRAAPRGPGIFEKQEPSGTSALSFHLLDNGDNIHEVHDLSGSNCKLANTSNYQQVIHDQETKKDHKDKPSDDRQWLKVTVLRRLKVMIKKTGLSSREQASARALQQAIAVSHNDRDCHPR